MQHGSVSMALGGDCGSFALDQYTEAAKATEVARPVVPGSEYNVEQASITAPMQLAGLTVQSFTESAQTAECKDTCRERNALQKQITATLDSGSKCTG